MNIYFDTCALNRLNDGDSSGRIVSEANAVIRLLDEVARGKLRWIASTVLQDELERNPNPIRRRDALAVLRNANEIISPSPDALSHAKILLTLGYRGLDSLHLAIAQLAEADWLVTTDDRFLRLGNRQRGTQKPELINPVELVKRRLPWLQKP